MLASLSVLRKAVRASRLNSFTLKISFSAGILTISKESRITSSRTTFKSAQILFEFTGNDNDNDNDISAKLPLPLLVECEFKVGS